MYFSVSNDRQWIEVDFLTSYAIGGISTQGSADSPYWVTRYEIYYSNDGQNFYPVPTSGNQIQNIFEGNTDQNTPVMHLFPVIHARYIRIRPIEYHGEIALRFNIFGCESPSATPPPLLVSTPTVGPSVTPTAQPSISPSFTSAGCRYWTSWVNSNKPSEGNEYESLQSLGGLVHVCQPQQALDIECRVAGTRVAWDQAGQKDVTCDKQQLMLMCLDTAEQTCFDYEIRVLCDECTSPTPAVTSPTPPLQGSCAAGWSPWYNRNKNVANGDHEQLSKEELESWCRGGKVSQVECNAVADNQPSYNKPLITNCDVETGFTCDAEINAPLPCEDFMIRYMCDCSGEFIS